MIEKVKSLEYKYAFVLSVQSIYILIGYLTRPNLVKIHDSVDVVCENNQSHHLVEIVYRTE